MDELIGQGIEEVDLSGISSDVVPVIDDAGKIIEFTSGYERPYVFVKFQDGIVIEESDYADIDYNALMYTD